VVLPDREGMVPILPWGDGVVVWSEGVPDGWVRPVDPSELWVAPKVGVPLFSIALSRSEHIVLGSTSLLFLIGFHEDLYEVTFV
jgi:hypothetical protein